ncbi:MAG: hypothetical protein BWK80_27385 [Desulfobacteraceae bacterium IS3]|nr:MAG: hypothetical protein BWK80_27385 [Desulfobacteraceae bacterium IS3]
MIAVQPSENSKVREEPDRNPANPLIRRIRGSDDLPEIPACLYANPCRYRPAFTAAASDRVLIPERKLFS